MPSYTLNPAKTETVESKPMPKVKGGGEAPRVKQPWEMIEEEFVGYGNNGKLHKIKGKISEQERIYEQKDGFKTALGYGEAAGYSPEDIVRFYKEREGVYRKGQHDSEWLDAVRRARKEIIRDAISEGKPIPPEILAD
jgi:hypothetical protein